MACATQVVSWEEQLPGAALKEGGTLLADELTAFAMHWPNIEHFWQVSFWHASASELSLCKLAMQLLLMVSSCMFSAYCLHLMTLFHHVVKRNVV